MFYVWFFYYKFVKTIEISRLKPYATIDAFCINIDIRFLSKFDSLQATNKMLP